MYKFGIKGIRIKNERERGKKRERDKKFKVKYY